MRTIALVFVGIAVLGGWAPASAQSPPGQHAPVGPPYAEKVTIVVPMFSQMIAVGMPKGWKVASENSTAALYVLEHIPGDQAPDTWTEMITVQGFKDAVKRRTADEDSYITHLMGRSKELCGDHAFARTFPKLTIDGYRAAVAVIGCAAFPQDQAYGTKRGQGELGLYLSIMGNNDLYVIHRSFRGPGFDPAKPPIGERTLAKWLEEIQPIKICDHDAGQRNCWERKPRSGVGSPDRILPTASGRR